MRVIYLLVFNAIWIALIAVACKHTPQNGELCEAKERDNRMCTADYQPVCGCDEQTYSNACEAKAHGITEYTEGECAQQ